MRGPVDTITQLKMSYKKRNHSRFGLLSQNEKLLSDIIEIDNLATAANVKWPLIICVPQKDLVDREKEKNVLIKWTVDPQAKKWTSETPLHVNREHIHRRYNLKVHSLYVSRALNVIPTPVVKKL